MSIGRSRGAVATGLMAIATGSGIAQLLGFVALPLLARLYTPAEMAHYFLLLGVGSVVSSIAGLRFELAIPIPEEEYESRQLFWLAVLAPLLTLPVIMLVASLSAKSGLVAMSLDWLDYLAVCAFVIVLVYYTAASQLAIRLRRYGLLGRIPAVQMTATLFGQISLGLAGLGRGLFVGGVFGRAFGLAGLARGTRVTWSDRPTSASTRVLLRRFWRFPAIFTPAALVNALGLNLPALLLPTIFGLGPAGLYAMAYRIAVAPSAALMQATSQVFLGEFARANDRPTALRIFLRWSAMLLALALSIVALMWIAAEAIPWILGDAWAGTAQLVRYAGVMSGAALLGSTVQGVWTVRQRGLAQFTWNVLRLVSTTAVILWAAGQGYPLESTVRYLALVTLGTYALSWLGCYWAAWASPRVPESVDP